MSVPAEQWRQDASGRYYYVTQAQGHWLQVFEDNSYNWGPQIHAGGAVQPAVYQQPKSSQATNAAPTLPDRQRVSPAAADSTAQNQRPRLSTRHPDNNSGHPDNTPVGYQRPRLQARPASTLTQHSSSDPPSLYPAQGPLRQWQEPHSSQGLGNSVSSHSAPLVTSSPSLPGMPSASSAFVLQPSIEHARLYGGQIDGVHIQDWNTGQALPPNGRRRMFYDAEKTEMLDSRFKKRSSPKKFFIPGRVFLVLWAEPAGGDNHSTMQTGLDYDQRFGEPIYSKVRRFVVIRQGDNYCTVLPIVTYGRQGVAKRGVKKVEHGIIYTGKVAPQPSSAELPARGETGMQPVPIRVDADEKSERLDPLSRVNYGRVYTVEHNVKVATFGMVHASSMDHLKNQFRDVWAANNAPGPVTRPGNSERQSWSSTQKGKSSQVQNPIQEGDEDEERSNDGGEEGREDERRDGSEDESEDDGVDESENEERTIEQRRSSIGASLTAHLGRGCTQGKAVATTERSHAKHRDAQGQNLQRAAAFQGSGQDKEDKVNAQSLSVYNDEEEMSVRQRGSGNGDHQERLDQRCREAGGSIRSEGGSQHDEQQYEDKGCQVGTERNGREDREDRDDETDTKTEEGIITLPQSREEDKTKGVRRPLSPSTASTTSDPADLEVIPAGVIVETEAEVLSWAEWLGWSAESSASITQLDSAAIKAAGSTELEMMLALIREELGLRIHVLKRTQAQSPHYAVENQWNGEIWIAGPAMVEDELSD